MDLYNIFIEYISKNWQGILITIIIGLFFFVLTPQGLKKYLKTAEVERRNRAKENILDLLESSLIYKQDLDSKKIYHLLSAIGREFELKIFSYFTAKSLLEDLELRFEKSKHLDPSQKQDYTRKIETLISDIEQENKDSEISASYNRLFENLKKSVIDGNNELSLKEIDILKKKLVHDPYQDESNLLFIIFKHRKIFYAVMIVLYLLIILKVFGQLF